VFIAGEPTRPDCWTGRVALLVLGLLLAPPVHGQSAASAYANWEAFTSMGRIAAVCATPSGVWCGTAGGVLRYDPRLRSYQRLTRLDGLAGNRVLSAAVDATGDIWFGTDGAGVSRFLAGSGYFAPPVLAFAGHRVAALAPHGPRLYAATESGVSSLLVEAGRVQETYRQFGSLTRGAEVLAVAVHDGDLWVGTAEGLARASLAAPNLQDPDAWDTTRSLRPGYAFAVAGSTLYCGSGQGVYRWDSANERWAFTGLTGKVSAMGAMSGDVVAVDGRGQLRTRDAAGHWQVTRHSARGELLSLSAAGNSLWIGSTDGLAALGASPPPALSDPPDDHFFDLAVGPDGDLWVASVPDDRTTDPRGVYRFDGSSWEVFDRYSGLPSDHAVAVEVDDDGQAWVGTWAHGLAIRSPAGGWSHLNASNSVLRGITAPRDPNFVVVGSLARDREGRMWMTNVQAGVAVMEKHPGGGSYMFDLATLGLPPGADMGPVAIGDDGLKFVGTPTRGLVVLDDGGTPFEGGDEWSVGITTASESRLSSDNITALLASSGVLWVGTDNGLHRVPYTYDGAGRFTVERWREYRLEHGLPSTDVTSLARDAQGQVWVGTHGGLVQIRATGLLVHAFTVRNSGLIADRVESVLYDASRGYLWVGTYEGLSRLRLEAPAEGDGTTVRVYPNPFVRGRGGAVTFHGLPLGTDLRIYAVDGSPVRLLTSSPGGAALTWDGTNEAGVPVASGVYYYTSAGEDPQLSGKVAVVAGD